ncbi:MAG TPA: alpha/beta hydrolase [Stellaceae bacterium]|nr:alpha/beta hydrolase [Stellaceae bacterium]
MVALLLGVAILPLGARGEFRLEPAYPETPLHGTKEARGAVIWNHGLNSLYGTEASAAPLPPLMVLFRDNGWDVYRLLRPRISEEPRRSRDEIIAAAGRLRAEGYGRIVLAGQSGGAWLALMAAAESDGIDAVIADAPAWYGTDHPTYVKNAAILYDYLDDIRHGRIMISFFADDPFDPGGRGEHSAAILSAHDVPYLIIDRPDGFSGHNSGDTALFLRRFGGCALAVAADGPMPTLDQCASDFGHVPSASLKLPADLAVATPNGGPADPFLGKWYGVYDNGRELMLVVEHATGDEVQAVCAYGAGPLPELKARVTERNGRVLGDTLVFAEHDRSTLRFHLVEGALRAQWTAADGKSTLRAALHLVP